MTSLIFLHRHVVDFEKERITLPFFVDTISMIIINMTAAALIACLAGLGIGGGGLLVIYLTLVLKTEQLTAQGINLIFFIFSALASLCIHFKKRRINIRTVALLAITGIAGSVLGSYISHNIEVEILRKIFGGLLIFSGVTVFLGRREDRNFS